MSARPASLAEAGVELGVVGRRDRLPPGLADAVAAAERLTCGGDRLRLRVALDYSSRYAIADAAADLAPAPPRRRGGRVRWKRTGRSCRMWTC